MSKRTRRNKERLDRNVVALVKTLNSFEGVRAIGSCGGHPEPRKPRQWPLGSWYVKLILSHDEHGWRALEFLAWLVLDIGRAGRRVILYPSAPPPHMNDPGKVLSFVLEGRSGEDPEEMARLRTWMDVYAQRQGAFSDETDRFGVGDVDVANEDLNHKPVAEPGPACICLAATDAPLRFSGLLPRLAQRFAKI